MTSRIVGLVPYGVGGNIGSPSGMPVFGVCGRVYNADEERAADVWRAQEYARQEEEAAEAAVRRAAEEERHRELAAENERLHGPPDPLREQVRQFDERLDKRRAKADAGESALAALAVAGVGTYLGVARSWPSAVGGRPEWMPELVMTVPGWIAWAVAATFLAFALLWAVVFLRNPSDTQWGWVSGVSAAAAVFGAYLIAVHHRPSPVGDPPGWLPSILVTMPDWVVLVTTMGLVVCALAWPVTQLCRRLDSDHRAALRIRRRDLLLRIGCGDPACLPCQKRRPRSDDIVPVVLDD